VTLVLTINAPPSLEDDLVDYILGSGLVGGFTSYPVMGHGESEDLSIAEQVAGSRKRIQFEVLIDESKAARLTDKLGSEVGPDITYWQYQLVGIGRT